MEQKKKNGGSKCAVKYCENKYATTNGMSFFTLPKDLERRAIWIKNCFFPELTDNTNFVSRYRVCQDHFENKMFLNINQKNRLTHFAVPTLFNNEILSKRAYFMTSINDKNHLNNKSFLDEVLTKSPDTEKLLDNQSNNLNIMIPYNEVLIKTEDSKIMIDNNSHSNITIHGTAPIKTSNSSSQTPLNLKQIEGTMKQLKLAKLRIKELELQVKKLNKSLLQNDSIDNFLNRCQKMLPPNLIFIIKSHLMCKQRKEGGFRYSKEMKEFALSIYFLSPRAYNFIKTKFSFPSIATLKRMTSKNEFLHIKTKFKKWKLPNSTDDNNYIQNQIVLQNNTESRLPQDMFLSLNTESSGTS